MKRQRQKEIESLRNRLVILEAEQERENRERETLDSAQAELLATLDGANISFEAYVCSFEKDIRKILNRIDRGQAKGPETAIKSSRPGTKKQVTKKRKRRSKTAVTVKIPAGNYSNIPEEPEKVFLVKEKGPRPKALKAYAEKIGLDAFLEQCRLSE